MCQHHCQQLNGILTYGALIVLPQEKTPRHSAKAALLAAGFSGADLFSPSLAKFGSEQVTGFPLAAEMLIFFLICCVITKLSVDLGREHNKRALAFSS